MIDNLFERNINTYPNFYFGHFETNGRWMFPCPFGGTFQIGKLNDFDLSMVGVDTSAATFSERVFNLVANEALTYAESDRYWLEAQKRQWHNSLYFDWRFHESTTKEFKTIDEHDREFCAWYKARYRVYIMQWQTVDPDGVFYAWLITDKQIPGPWRAGPMDRTFVWDLGTNEVKFDPNNAPQHITGLLLKTGPF